MFDVILDGNIGRMKRRKMESNVAEFLSVLRD